MCVGINSRFEKSIVIEQLKTCHQVFTVIITSWCQFPHALKRLIEHQLRRLGSALVTISLMQQHLDRHGVGACCSSFISCRHTHFQLLNPSNSQSDKKCMTAATLPAVQRGMHSQLAGIEWRLHPCSARLGPGIVDLAAPLRMHPAGESKEYHSHFIGELFLVLIYEIHSVNKIIRKYQRYHLKTIILIKLFFQHEQLVS